MGNLNFVFILIILNLSLWVLYYTVKLWNAHFGTTWGCSIICCQQNFYLLRSSLWICILKMIKMYGELDRKSPFTKTEYYHRSFLISGCNAWNNLPDYIRKSVSLNTFKFNMFKYLLADTILITIISIFSNFNNFICK